MPMVSLPKYRATRLGANRRAGRAPGALVSGLVETEIGSFPPFLAARRSKGLEKIYAQMKQAFKNKLVFTLIKDGIN